MNSVTPKLTAQQLMFCREYVATIDLDGTKAAIRAGYKKTSAMFQASRLLRKDNIKAEIKRLMEKRIERVDITADMVAQRLYKLAFYDVRNLFDQNGNLIPIKSLDDATAPAVIGVKVTPGRRKRGRQVSRRVESIKLANPKDSLELLGRHLGMFKDVVKIERDEFAGKTPEELEYYATHDGQWPTTNRGAGEVGEGAQAGDGAKIGERDPAE
jgi:phage terminase small subunit